MVDYKIEYLDNRTLEAEFYIKNNDGQSGSDCAWIDDITFPRTCYITKVEEVVAPKANAIYPNPTSGSFNIELAEESNVTVFNALGQVVRHLEKAAGNQQIDLSEAPKGLYFVRIQSGNNVEITKLIVN
jgi:hypothetical protein